MKCYPFWTVEIQARQERQAILIPPYLITEASDSEPLIFLHNFFSNAPLDRACQYSNIITGKAVNYIHQRRSLENNSLNKVTKTKL